MRILTDRKVNVKEIITTTLPIVSKAASQKMLAVNLIGISLIYREYLFVLILQCWKSTVTKATESNGWTKIELFKRQNVWCLVPSGNIEYVLYLRFRTWMLYQLYCFIIIIICVDAAGWGPSEPRFCCRWNCKGDSHIWWNISSSQGRRGLSYSLICGGHWRDPWLVYWIQLPSGLGLDRLVSPKNVHENKKSIKY